MGGYPDEEGAAVACTSDPFGVGIVRGIRGKAAAVPVALGEPNGVGALLDCFRWGEPNGIEESLNEGATEADSFLEPIRVGSLLDIGRYADPFLGALVFGWRESNGVGPLIDIVGYTDKTLCFAWGEPKGIGSLLDIAESPDLEATETDCFSEPIGVGALLDIGGYAEAELIGLALGGRESTGAGALLDTGR